MHESVVERDPVPRLLDQVTQTDLPRWRHRWLIRRIRCLLRQEQRNCETESGNGKG